LEERRIIVGGRTGIEKRGKNMAASGQGYNGTVVTQLGPEEAMQAIIGGLAGTSECTVNAAGNNTIILTRRYLPNSAIVLAVLGVLLFLIGLLALFVRNTETLTITLASTPEGTRVTASGVASQELANRLNGLMASLRNARSSVPSAPRPGPAAVVGEETKVCPQCAESVKAAAKMCRFCQYRFEEAMPGTGAPSQPEDRHRSGVAERGFFHKP
jgi:hypothetical protein